MERPRTPACLRPAACREGAASAARPGSRGTAAEGALPSSPRCPSRPSGRPALGTLRCRVDHKATNITEANDSPTGLTESVDEDLLTRQVVPVYSVPVAAPKGWSNPGPRILFQLLSLLTREETGLLNTSFCSLASASSSFKSSSSRSMTSSPAGLEAGASRFRLD